SLAFLFALFASFELFSLSLHDALPIWKWVVVNRLDDDSARLLSRMVNRIALGMMASGMFVGSSLLLSFGGEQALSIPAIRWLATDRKSTRLNSSHVKISYAVFCLKKKT